MATWPLHCHSPQRLGFHDCHESGSGVQDVSRSIVGAQRNLLSATSLFPGPDKSAPSAYIAIAPCFVVSYGVKLSEVVLGTIPVEGVGLLFLDDCGTRGVVKCSRKNPGR